MNCTHKSKQPANRHAAPNRKSNSIPRFQAFLSTLPATKQPPTRVPRAASQRTYIETLHRRETHPSIRGTSVRILLMTSSLCWCVAGAVWRSSGMQRPPRRRAAISSSTGAMSRHLRRTLSARRSLPLLPLLGESSQGGGSRTVPLHGATSGSSVRHVVWKAQDEGPRLIR